MMKITYSFLLIAALSLLFLSSLQAQEDCATGYCPSTITVHHKAGDVSPVTADITYKVVKSAITGENKCWLAQNLGASAQATAFSDCRQATRGWYWSFAQKRGYKYDQLTSSFTPNPATYAEDLTVARGEWLSESDPCHLLLGRSWRLPTQTELVSVGNTIFGGTGTSGLSISLLNSRAGELSLNVSGFISVLSTVYWQGYSTTYKVNNAENGSIIMMSASSQTISAGYLCLYVQFDGDASIARTTYRPNLYYGSIRCVSDL